MRTTTAPAADPQQSPYSPHEIARHIATRPAIAAAYAADLLALPLAMRSRSFRNTLPPDTLHGICVRWNGMHVSADYDAVVGDAAEFVDCWGLPCTDERAAEIVDTLTAAQSDRLERALQREADEDRAAAMGD